MDKDKLTAGAICNRAVSVAYPGLSVFDAARAMRDEHVGCLVVVEESAPQDRQVVGIFTDRDIVTGIVAAQRDPQGLCVADLMSRDVVTVREEDSVLDVLAAMRRKAVRRVPVLGAHGSLAGIVAVDDVLERIGEEMQALVAAVAAAKRHEQASSR